MSNRNLSDCKVDQYVVLVKEKGSKVYRPTRNRVHRGSVVYDSRKGAEDWVRWSRDGGMYDPEAPMVVAKVVNVVGGKEPESYDAYDKRLFPALPRLRRLLCHATDDGRLAVPAFPTITGCPEGWRRLTAHNKQAQNRNLSELPPGSKWVLAFYGCEGSKACDKLHPYMLKDSNEDWKRWVPIHRVGPHQLFHCTLEPRGEK